MSGEARYDQAARGTRHARAASVCVLAVLLAAMGGLFAEDIKDKDLKIGSELPDFNLTDYEGKEHTLSRYRGKVVVLNFCSQECPWSRGVDLSLRVVAEEYAKRGVVFLGVDSHRDTPPNAIKEYALKTKLPYPIVKDERNVYADKVAATRSPEFFVLNKEGKLAYHGAYDDRRAPEKNGDANYLTTAIDAVLAGEKVETPEVDAWGCSIKRVPKEPKREAPAKDAGSKSKGSGASSGGAGSGTRY